MKRSKVKLCILSEIGPVRPNNEDAYLALRKHSFFAIADGMGGHNAGEVASKETIEKLSQAIQRIPIQNSKEFLEILQEAIHDVNAKVFQMGQENSHLQGMGTTLCCLQLYPDDVIYAHVGDSRIYRYRKNELKQLTEDHALFTSTPQKIVITRAIGTSPKVEPEIASATVEKGDIFFMCTDGLTNFVTMQEMEEILAKSLPLKKTVKQFIRAALTKGSYDNITVLMLQIR